MSQKSSNTIVRPVFVALAFAGLSLAFGCASAVGDDCANNQDCPSGTYCDKAMPGGYCTLANCRDGDCPEGSICVEFYNGERFCMASCSGNDDCRDDYECIKTVGDDPFCSVNDE